MSSAQKTVISAAILLASLFANILLAFHNQWAVVKAEYGVSGKYGLWNACDDGDTGVCSPYSADVYTTMTKVIIMGAFSFGLLCLILWGVLWTPDRFSDSQIVLGGGLTCKGTAIVVGALEFVINMNLSSTTSDVSVSPGTACYLMIGLGVLDVIIGIVIRMSGTYASSSSSPPASSSSSSSTATRIEGNVGIAYPRPQRRRVDDGVALIN